MNLDNTFAALSDETRRAILKRLQLGETPLSELAEPFNMTQTAVSKHVKVLSQAGLVDIEKRGRIRHCKLNATVMRSAYDWIADYQSFWTGQLGSLGDYLQQEEKS